MRIAAIIPTKGDRPEDVARVVSSLPLGLNIDPWVLWWQTPIWSDTLARQRMELTTIPVTNGRWPGVGLAYREGFARVVATERYSHVLMFDGDGDMDHRAIPYMLAAAESGAELVVASRWARGGGFVGYDTRKLAVNGLGNLAFRLLLRSPISDLTFGFKLLSVPLLKRLRLEEPGHGIYAETTMLPVAMGARCAEVPTVWRGRRNGVATLDVAAAAKVYARVGLRALRLKCASM
jgi:hypothetical protein